MNPEYTHPVEETPPAAFCQNCGRPLTASEVRSVAGHVYCEPCLLARLGGQPAAAPAAGAPYTAPYVAPTPYPGVNPVNHSPFVAGLLGTIPGVGAMYNGQFIKGIVHVIIFIALISATTHFGLLGIAIGVWWIYMIFDAVQTANAIRMGMPLPDPLGLNSIGARMGIATAQAPVSGVPPAAPPPAPQYSPEAAAPPSASAAIAPVVPAYGAPPPYTPAAMPPPPARPGVPVGAVILIALGALFALGTFDVIGEHWISNGWPVLLIALGIWLFYRNTRTYGGPQ